MLVSCSFDDIGERFEYQRYGGSFNSVVENMKKINDFFGKIDISITLTTLNALYIDQVFDFIENNRNSRQFDYFLTKEPKYH